MQTNINIKNKKATFEYFIVDTYTAGIVLSGTEIKALREGKANLTDSYCSFFNGELWARNLHISEYKFGTCNNHLPKRERKLLLNKRELKKLELKMKDKGNTIIPIRLFINEKGLAKLEIALARGKKLYDKRDDLKLKDHKREMDRAIKQ